MQTPPDWAAYAATVPVLENRRQSLAFMAGVNLKPQALRAPTNHIDKSPRKLEDWSYVDTFQNWGCPLVGDFLDVDVDVRPRGNHEDPKAYTPAFYTTALLVVQLVHAAFTSAGLRFRAFGRGSLGKLGHFILECPVPKADEECLRRLHMRRYVETDEVMVRIEVRRRAEKKEGSKNWTLPGSVYRRHDGAGYDLIEWSVRNNYFEADGAVMPRLDPQPYEKLRLGMYMSLMGLALLPHWESGARHDCAFHLAGALAHEWREGTFSEDECTAIMQFMVDQAADTQGKDRLQCVDDALRALENNRKVTGYTRLAEQFIGDDWKKAILALRGGGDPDATGRLFEIVARINKGPKGHDFYTDLSVGSSSAFVEMNATDLRHRFKNHPDFPPVTNAKGKLVHPVDIVMNSPYIKTFARTVSFPGVPFGVEYIYDRSTQAFIEVAGEDDKPPGEPLYLNIASGFPTAPYAPGEAPDAQVWREVLRHWRKLLGHLSDTDARQADDLEQIIAHKLQHVRIKQQVGCALVGGAQIGKTFLFETLLAALLGDDLIKKSSTAELDGQYRFTGIEYVLFYVVEECKFNELPRAVLQMIKDAMRNRRIHRNVKYGDVGDVGNVAVPFFLSNDLNPRLIFDGIPDRALVIIRGEHQASLGMTATEWEEHQAKIKGELVAFAEALKREDIRRALLHYFLEIELRDDIFMKNESRVDPVDFMAGQTPIQSALLDILREGYLMPLRPRGERGPSLRDPFAMETLAAGLRERLRDQRVSTFETTTTRAANAVAELFRENIRERGTRKSEGTTRSKRDKILKLVRYRDKEVDKGMYYFALRRGSLLQLLEERTLIKLEPEYTLDADGELGEAPEPKREELARWYRYAADQAGQSFSRFGIV